MEWPPLSSPQPSGTPSYAQPHTVPVRSFSQTDFSVISNLLRNPDVSPGRVLESALSRTGIEPDAGLIQAVFEHFDSSPRLLHTLFLWAQRKPGFKPSVKLFNSMINVLAKARDFDSAWSMVLDKVGDEELDFVSKGTFVILIRRYSRAGTVDFLHHNIKISNLNFRFCIYYLYLNFIIGLIFLNWMNLTAVIEDTCFNLETERNLKIASDRKLIYARLLRNISKTIQFTFSRALGGQFV